MKDIKSFKELGEANALSRSDALEKDLKKVAFKNGNFVDDSSSDLIRLVYQRNSVPNIVTPKLMDKLSDIVKKHNASVSWNTKDGTFIFMLDR